MMNLFGKEVAFEDRTPDAYLASSATERNEWFSDTSLRVKLSSGFGTFLSLIVSMNAVVIFGYMEFFSFDSELISSLSISNAPTTVSLTITALEV